MTSRAHNRLTIVWALLAGMTVLSWWSGTQSEAGAAYQMNAVVTVGVLAIAFIKSRLVMRYFMEVRTAPRWLRHICDGWLILVFGMFSVFYWFGL